MKAETKNPNFFFSRFFCKHPTIIVVRIRWDIIHRSFCLKNRVFRRVRMCAPFVFYQIFVFYSLSTPYAWRAGSTSSFFAPIFFFVTFYNLFSEQTNVCRSWGSWGTYQQRCAMRYGRYTSMANLVSLLSHASTHSPTHAHTRTPTQVRAHQQTLICSLNLVEFRLSEKVSTRDRAGTTFFTRLGTRLFNLCRTTVEESKKKKWRNEGEQNAAARGADDVFKRLKNNFWTQFSTRFENQSAVSFPNFFFLPR